MLKHFSFSGAPLILLMYEIFYKRTSISPHLYLIRFITPWARELWARDQELGEDCSEKSAFLCCFVKD